MSNGLGTGFAAVTLLAVLAGVAVLAALITAGSYGICRRTGQIPSAHRYLFAVPYVAALVISGFGVLALFDEAPLVAWLLACLALLPLVGSSAYLRRKSRLTVAESVAVTVAAWSVPFLAGVVVVFAATSALNAALGVPSAARGTGVRWVASGLGGLVVFVGTVVAGTCLFRAIRAGTDRQKE